LDRREPVSAEPQLDPAGTAALIDVVPASAPSAAATATLVTSIRDQAGAISRTTGANVAVTGTTAIDVDVSAKLSAALLPFAGIVVGLSLLLLMLVFRSLIVPVKAAIGFLLSVGASFGATVAVFQWGWLAGPLGVTAGPVASFGCPATPPSSPSPWPTPPHADGWRSHSRS
jgi:RND superfamily putative drug exporter